jgi:hypothetical protein
VEITMLKRPDDVTKPAIAASHALLTGAWTVYVKAMEEALGRLGMDRGAAEDCRVTFFEVAGDRHLHVNITRRSATVAVNGWAGPATTADGVVYNQMFDRMPRYQLLRQLKHMIFAAPS